MKTRITGLTQKTRALLAAAIAKCRALTKKPFAVNLTFLPTVSSPDYPGYIKAIVDGFECGGHPGEDDIPNFILLPRAADELKDPFVASGGMADGRSLVAALALGAEGVNMGTRFIATKETPVRRNVKDAIVAASELDTRLVMRPLRNTERVLRNAAVDRLLEKEKTLGATLKFDDILDEVAVVCPKIMLGGHGRRRLELRHGGRPDQRHPDGEGIDRPHHGRGRGHHRPAPGALCGGGLSEPQALR